MNRDKRIKETFNSNSENSNQNSNNENSNSDNSNSDNSNFMTGNAVNNVSIPIIVTGSGYGPFTDGVIDIGKIVSTDINI